MFSNINFSSINIVTVLFIATLGITLTYVFFLIFKKVMMEKRIRERRIKPRKIKNNKNSNNKNTWFNAIFSKIDTEYLELKLIHAGNPMGISDVGTYMIVKFLFTICGIIAGLELYDAESLGKSILIIMVFTVIGFFVVDFIIKESAKTRTNKINNQLPNFLVYFDNYNKAGLMFEDILSTIIDILHGELKKEVIRFNVNYSMTKEFEPALKEFTRRLGSADVDSLEIKLRQCYFSGVYDDLISDEKELIDKKIVNDIAKQTKQFDLYLAIAMGLLIFNLFLWIIYPLMTMVTRDMSGIF